jgi:steroid delta-isomerase
MDAAEKISVVEKYIEAFENRSLELIREIYADTATVEDPVGTDVYDGIDAILGFYTGGFEMGAKLSLLGKPRCAGNSVAFPFQVVAGGMTIEVIDVFEFDDEGKVISMKAYWGPENAS